MRQVISTPGNPPAQGPSLSRDIEQAVREALSGALAPVRDQLRNQVESARERRVELLERMDATESPAARRELQAQMREVDGDISRLESSLARLDREAAMSGQGFTTQIGFAPSPPPPPNDPFNPAPMVIAVVAIVLVGFPLALTMARLIWKRATNTMPPAVTAETARRFDRLEQSVDAIAIEVERISENQRYLTRILAEPKQGVPVGSGSKDS